MSKKPDPLAAMLDKAKSHNRYSRPGKLDTPEYAGVREALIEFARRRGQKDGHSAGINWFVKHGLRILNENGANLPMQITSTTAMKWLAEHHPKLAENFDRNL